MSTAATSTSAARLVQSSAVETSGSSAWVARATTAVAITTAKAPSGSAARARRMRYRRPGAVWWSCHLSQRYATGFR
jgi:hypothetical protein